MDIVKKIALREKGTPATEDAILNAESEMGIQFPQILREIYTKVANGGIGPGYKILGVSGGHTSDEGDTISELYKNLLGSDPDDPKWKWPKGLVPFCHWGCAIYSCFDTNKENNPVVWFDPNMREIGEPMQQQFISHRESLESWFQAWLDGVDLWEETYGA